MLCTWTPGLLREVSHLTSMELKSKVMSGPWFEPRQSERRRDHVAVIEATYDLTVDETESERFAAGSRRAV